MSSRIIRLLAALAICAIAVPAIAAEKVTIQLEYGFPVGDHAGVRLAEAKGWYKDAGLDVTILMGKGSVVTIQQIAAGQGDVGLAQLSAVAQSVSNGLPVTSIMSMIQNGDLALIMGADTGYKTIQDLKGKSIGSPSAGTATALLPAFLKKIGISPDDVKITYIDSASVLTSFTSKANDGLINGGTYILPRVVGKREAIAVYFSDVGLNLPGYGLMANLDTIKKRPEVLTKVIHANQRAWAYIMDGHVDEAVADLVKSGEQFRPDPVGLKGEIELMLQRFQTAGNKGHPIGWESKEDWQQVLTVMESVNLVKPGWKVEDYFTNQFIGDIGKN